MRRNTLDDLLARTSLGENGCRIWQGAAYDNGYGSGSLDGKQGRVHRLVWAAVNGPIPNGMLVCHRCDVRLCCNPDHLFLGTQRDNIQDMISKGRASDRTVPKSPRMRERSSAAAKARWDRMTDEERADLGRIMGEARRGKTRGPYRKRFERGTSCTPEGA